MARPSLALAIFLFLVGCDKHRDEAIVISKEHIAAAPVATPGNERTSGHENSVRSIRDDEITVDSYVMKREDRGTIRDPRALPDEQWLVKVQIVGGRAFNVQSDQAQFDRLKEGDGVRVRYWVGKYTKTVWGAKILDSRQ